MMEAVRWARRKRKRRGPAGFHDQAQNSFDGKPRESSRDGCAWVSERVEHAECDGWAGWLRFSSWGLRLEADKNRKTNGSCAREGRWAAAGWRRMSVCDIWVCFWSWQKSYREDTVKCHFPQRLRNHQGNFVWFPYSRIRPAIKALFSGGREGGGIDWLEVEILFHKALFQLGGY